MKMTQRKRVGGACLMLAATLMMVTLPKTTHAATQEVGVLQEVYGFGTWTSVGFGLLGAGVCTVASGGLGVGLCGAAATI